MAVITALPSKPSTTHSSDVQALENEERVRAALAAVRATMAAPAHRSAHRPLAAAGSAALAVHAQLSPDQLAHTDPEDLAAAAVDLLADLLHLAAAARVPDQALAVMRDRHLLGSLVPGMPAERTVAEGIAICWNNLLRFLTTQGLYRTAQRQITARAQSYWCQETPPATVARAA